MVALKTLAISDFSLASDVFFCSETGKIKKNMSYKFYFRKGEVADSKNYLTPEMENKIDMIIQEKLQGSGLKF